jgi:hypothetical protein
MAELFPTVIAGALVTGFAWARFPAPGIAQIATTQIQFYWSRAAYVLAALAFYAALAKAIDAADGLAGGTAPSPYVAALLMTTLLPHFPGVAAIDRAVLRLFHALGSMPVEFARLAERLEHAPYVAPGRFRRAIVEYVHANGLPSALVDELRFVDGDSARARFTRNLSLYVEIQHLKGSPRFRRFFAEFAAETASFERDFAKFVAQSAAFFAFSASVPEDRQRALAALTDARRTFKSQCADCNRLLALFLARALLKSSWASSDVDEHLKNLGFATPAARSPGLKPLSTFATIGVYIVVMCAAGLWTGMPW